jgi:hypothetical protein
MALSSTLSAKASPVGSRARLWRPASYASSWRSCMASSSGTSVWALARTSAMGLSRQPDCSSMRIASHGPCVKQVAHSAIGCKNGCARSWCSGMAENQRASMRMRPCSRNCAA